MMRFIYVKFCNAVAGSLPTKDSGTRGIGLATQEARTYKTYGHPVSYPMSST